VTLHTDDGVIRALAQDRTRRVSRGRRLVLVGAAVVTVAAATFAVGRGVASDTGGGATAVAGSATSPPSGPGTADAISDFAFAPQTVTVKAGGAVTWTNKDPFAHSIKSNDGTFASQDLQQGQTFTATFSTPGTFAYICGIHTFMTGTIVVQG
jgi:plastocyanin